MVGYTEAYWTCCGMRLPYTIYRCSKCGAFTVKPSKVKASTSGKATGEEGEE